MSDRTDWTWAVFRHDFSTAGDHSGIKAVVPWGGDRAIIVTGEKVYMAEEHEEAGFIIREVARR